MNIFGLLGFVIPGLIVLTIVAFSPNIPCKCGGDYIQRFNGEYMCDECGSFLDEI